MTNFKIQIFKTILGGTFVVLSAFSTSAFSDDAVNAPDARLPGGDNPAGETVYAPPLDQAKPPEPDPAWYAATGAKKGIIDQAAVPEEVFAAPDTAVLARGFYAQWPGMLAEFQEPWVFVEPGQMAGLHKTKPLLIIPSGALYGLNESEFFKAGLAEFARSGGVILCLTQQRGEDFSALPVPEGSRIEAAGWAQDSGPLFRASTLRGRHSLLSGIKPTPEAETDGYLISYPPGSRILLSRPDDFSTLIVYPFGKGWVVVTTLFSDFSYGMGGLNPDEKTLLRNFVTWSKSPDRDQKISSGEAASIPRAGQPLSPFPARPAVLPAIERRGSRITLNFEIAPVPGLTGQDMFLRAGSQEKFFRLTKDKTVLSFEIPAKEAGAGLVYALYHSSGRSLVRGAFRVPEGEKEVVLDRPYYLPGQNVHVMISGLGKGELNLTAPGYQDNMMVSGNGETEFTLPSEIPSGAYTLQWDLHGLDGKVKHGETPVNISGIGVKFRGASLEKKFEKGLLSTKAGFRVESSQKLSARIKLWLLSPDGKTTPAADSAVTLSQGPQDISLPFSIKPAQAGIWELIYGIYVSLPQGPGVPSGPVLMASGRKAFDMGDAAVLGIATDKPLYYESAGQVTSSSYVFGKGKTKVEIYLDGKKVAKERYDLAGLSALDTLLPPLAPGVHHVRVAASGEKLESVKELTFTYGIRLPDLAVSIKTSEPQGVVMSVGIGIRNQGKSPSGRSRAALYEGDPAKGGTLIAGAEAPPLKPGEQHVSLINWPLRKKAGMRTLYAVADPENAVTESNENNNAASVQVKIPDLLLTLTAQKNAFTTDESIPLSVFAANLAETAYKALSLKIQLTDQAGKVVASESAYLQDFAPGSEKTIAQAVGLASLPTGAYRMTTQISGDAVLASKSSEITVLPTLLLKGTLEGTPSRAAPCRPLVVAYSVKSTGNIPASTGSVKVEIKEAKSGTPAFAQQLPLSGKTEFIKIDRLDIPQGGYTVTLKASAANRQYGITREFALAEQALTVSGPVDVRKSAAPFPRVLVWYGRSGNTVAQAVADTVLKQAFEQQPLFYKAVTQASDFKNQALTGVFNTYVLFETEEIADTFDWLRDRVNRGQGLVIIGEGEHARAAGEAFGFTFGQPLSESDRMLAVTQDGLSLSGTFAVSSRILTPQKKGAKPAAVLAGGKQPAALMDASEKGRVMLLPFSLVYSARDSGTTGIYSLLLRAAALSVAPESEEQAGTAAGELLVTSPTGPVNARIVETLPPGSRVVWTGPEGTSKGIVVTFELTADTDPERLLYLYQPADPASRKTDTEVFYECEGKYVSQGKIE